MKGHKLIEKPGWNFDNSYSLLPGHFHTMIKPTPVAHPHLVIVNHDLSHQLGLTLDQHSNDQLAQLFSGNELPSGASPLAQAYAGHQFGHFTFLGDGRAHLIGEHLASDGTRVDIQLKGSGPTPYAKSGDGRAALGPMLREYILSEAMHNLGIPTTRNLALVTTGENVYRDKVRQGAIFTRVASSHIRIGTFQYLAAQKDFKGLKILADYAIDRHYPTLKFSTNPYLDFFQSVMARQIDLVVDWLRVGFIHGVMNTDNMTISGETIDYGPCAFLDEYDPQKVFSSIDQKKRYSYTKQSHIAQWNLARFGESLLPLLHKDIDQATALAQEVIELFKMHFQEAWLSMMRRKLGLIEEQASDEILITDLLNWMEKHEADYTNTFRDLSAEHIPKYDCYVNDDFQKWWKRWIKRLQQNSIPLESAFCLMKQHNPAVIPRNHCVEQVIAAAENKNDFSKLHAMLDIIADPYVDKTRDKKFQSPPQPAERVYKTFCGT